MIRSVKKILSESLSRVVAVFYPQCRGIDPLHIFCTCFVTQKILRINGSVPWPVHFTSRVLYHKNIKIGKRTAPGFSSCCYVQGRNGIIIGDNLRMGPGVGIVSANHSIDNYDCWDEVGPIVIGDNVWIGMNAVLLPGVKIGSNVVIGANSVVNRNIPDNVLAAGTPCRVIGSKAPYNGFYYSQL